MKRFLRGLGFLFFWIFFVPLVFAEAEKYGIIKSSGLFVFKESKISDAKPKGHHRLDTDDFIMVPAEVVTAFEPIMDWLFESPSATTVSSLTVSTPMPATGNMTGNTTSYAVAIPAGVEYTPYTPPPSISQEVIQEAQQQSLGPVLRTLSLGLGIGIDTFWTSGNKAFEAEVELACNFEMDRWRNYNDKLIKKELDTSKPLRFGYLEVTTKKSRFIRQLGGSLGLTLDYKWKGKWSGLDLTKVVDIGIDIDERDKEKIGSAVLMHNDEVDLGLIASLLEAGIDKICAKFVKKAAEEAAKDAAEKTLREKVKDWLKDKAKDQIKDKLKPQLGVLACMGTAERAISVSLIPEVRDFNGKIIEGVMVVSTPYIITSESENVPLLLSLPPNCPPIRSITLTTESAVYRYKELGNVEIGLGYGDARLTTGFINDLTGVYLTNDEHSIPTNQGIIFDASVEPYLVQIPFKGYLVTESGHPLSNVMLDVSSPGGIYFTTFTDANGYFSHIFNISSNKAEWNDNDFADFFRRLSVNVYSSNYIKDRVEFISVAAGIKIHMKSFTSLNVSGRVYDPQGNPLKGVEVDISSWDSTVEVVTDSEGKYSGQLPLVIPSSLFSSTEFTLTPSQNASGGSSIAAFSNLVVTVHPIHPNYRFPMITKTLDELMPKDPTSGIRIISNQPINLQLDFTATSQAPKGSIGLYFKGPAVNQLERVSLTLSDGTNYICNLEKDTLSGMKYVFVDTEKDQETVNISALGFHLQPFKVTTNFSPSGIGQVKYFDINVVKATVEDKDIELSPLNLTLDRSKEANLEVSIKNAPPGRLPITINAIDKTNNNIKILFTTGSFGSASEDYITLYTDANGKAKVKIKGRPIDYNKDETGTVTIQASFLDKKSNTCKIEFVPYVPPEIVVSKPTASIQIASYTKGISPALTPDPLIPTIEKGGDITFAFSYTLGEPLKWGTETIEGHITGYKIAFSRDGGPWTEETYDTAPSMLKKTFNEPGKYKIRCMVKKMCLKEVWSDPVERRFDVIDITPPQVSLNIPKTVGYVNLPLDYSFTASSFSPFKRITLSFGDNFLDLDFDPWILSGKNSFSGSYFHTYQKEGTYTIKLQAINIFDRISEVTKQVTIKPQSEINDKRPPTGSLVINNGQSTTSDRNVALTITGNDADGVGVYSFRLSNDGTNWTDWYGVSTENRPYSEINFMRGWQLSEGAGQKTVYLQLKDAAGNISSVITANITLSAAQLTIGSGLSSPQITDTSYQGRNPPAPYGSINIIRRQGNVLSVAFSATQDWAIIVNQMALSFDGNNWTSWMPYQTNKEIDISNYPNATKLYVRYADASGGISDIYSADIPPVGVSGQISTQLPSATAEAQVSSGQVSQAPSTTTQPSFTPSVSQEKPQEQIEIELVDLNIPQEVNLGERLEITARVKNYSKLSIKNCSLSLEIEDGFKEQKGFSLKAETLERIKFLWQPKKEGIFKVKAEVILPEGLVDKDTRNNAIEERIKVKPKVEVDLSILDISLPPEVHIGREVEIEITVLNDSEIEAKDCELNISIGDGSRDKKTLSLKPKAREKSIFRWTPRSEGNFRIEVKIDPPKGLEDKNIRNNTSTKTVNVEI